MKMEIYRLGTIEFEKASTKGTYHLKVACDDAVTYEFLKPECTKTDGVLSFDVNELVNMRNLIDEILEDLRNE